MITVKAKPKTKPQIVIVKKDDLRDIVIIGGGPAGLTSAIYAARAGLKTTVIERALVGGMITTTDRVENYPGFPEGISGIELGQKLEQQAKNLGVEISWGSVNKIENTQKIKKVYLEDKVLETKTIIIASGTSSKKMGIKGEADFRGRGVSYCATCDGAFYKNKNIMVIGGGNAAIEEALYLSNIAAKVSIVHRRSTLRADALLAARANLDPKIYFIWDSVLEEIRGDKTVKEAIVKNVKTNKLNNYPIDGIFVYIGSDPNTDFLEGMVKLDKYKFITTDEEMNTSLPGIFAAGDVRKKSLRQVSTAVGDGAIAAESARKYIEELGFKKK